MGIREVASRSPDKPALLLVGSDERRTYGELSRRADRLAQLFRSLGLAPGDGIAFTITNCPELLEIAVAAMRAGLYYTAVSTQLTPAETHYIVNDCGASAYLVSAQYADLAREMDHLLERRVRRFSVGGSLEGYESLESAAGDMPEEALRDETRGQDLLYSSGTTGQPKGIRVPLSGDSPETMPDNGKAVAALYSFGPETVYLSPAPLYHAAPLRFNLVNLMLGGTSVIMGADDVRAHAETPGTGARRSRPVEHGLRNPRRGPVPGCSQEANARMVGAGALRILRRQRE